MQNTLYADILQQGLDLKVEVTGNSMHPFISSGDFVTLRKVAPDSLKCGEIIYFTGPHGSQILHRITYILSVPGEGITIITKGDAHRQGEAAVQGNQVMGKAVSVEKRLPFIGSKSLNLESILLLSLSKIHNRYFRARCWIADHL